MRIRVASALFVVALIALFAAPVCRAQAANSPVLQVKAWRKAVDWFYDTKNRAEAVAILVKESGQTQGNIEKTYDYYRSLHIFPEDGTIDAKNLTALVD